MRVVFRDAARADIVALHDYISRDNPPAARQVAALIESATDRLSQFPYSGRVGAVAGTRELVVPRVPYVVTYRVAKDVVDVLAVFHAAQDRTRT